MIYIIVPTFARVEETQKFLVSVAKSVNQAYKVLLIDDHPEKITFKSIEESDNISILKPKKELWWVGSINLGIKTLFEEYNLRKEDIVIFANNDVQINPKDFNLLCKIIQEGEEQIIHPRTFNQRGEEVSSGAKIKCLFPYITIHPKDFKKDKFCIDMGTARFLMMKGTVLEKVGFVNKDLLQYLGDNDFTLTAKKKFTIPTYIVRETRCLLNDEQTGMKNTNLTRFKELYTSFYSVKSPNNIKYRYLFFKKFFGKVSAVLIVFSMTLNAIVKFGLNKING